MLFVFFKIIVAMQRMTTDDCVNILQTSSCTFSFEQCGLCRWSFSTVYQIHFANELLSLCLSLVNIYTCTIIRMFMLALSDALFLLYTK